MSTPSGAPGGPPRKASSGGGLGAFVSAHKGPVTIGAAALGVVVLALYERSRSSSSSTSGTAGAGTSAGTTTVPVASTVGTGSGSAYDTLEQQVSGLQSQLASITAATNPDGTTASTPSGTPPSLGSVTLGGAPGLPNAGIWGSQVATGTTPGGAGPNIPFGTYQLAGAPISQNGQTYYPITGPGGATLYALGENVSGYSQ